MRYGRRGMGGIWTIRGAWVAAVLVTGLVFVVAGANGDLYETSGLTSVLGLAVSVTGLAVSRMREPAAGDGRPASDERLDRLARQLADAVGEQWTEEWRLRRLQDPEPLSVRWTRAEAWLADHQENIGGPADLSDRLENVTAVVDRVPSRRLVVLGGPGGGKTVLAVRYALDALKRWQPGAPVPVVFPLAAWQPDRETLSAWMAAHIAQTYPGATWGGELLAAERILPVLDGLDELAAPLRAHAVRRLNAELDPGSPVLLTCRTQVYGEVVEAGDIFTSAAVVELQPLSFEEASRYLVRTARPLRGSDGQRSTCWDPVLTRLRAHPGDPSGAALRQVLGTPLMVAMARTVYGDTGADPMELLEDGRFWGPEALEQHLLDAFVPAAFGDAPDADRAGHWLRFLARHLERRGTRDLAWWELRLALPWLLRRLGPVLLLGCMATAVTIGLGEPTTALAGVIAFVAGVCTGHVVLSRGRTWAEPGRAARSGQPAGRWWIPRELVLSVAVAAPLGVAVGSAGSLGFAWGDFSPIHFNAGGRLGPVAAAMAAGLATATMLAVLGLAGDVRPSTMPLLGRQRLRSPVLGVLSVAAVLLAAFVAFVLGTEFVSEPVSLAIGALAGLVVALAVWPGVTGRAAAPVIRRERRRRPGRALLRPLSVGLLGGLCLGAAFGLAHASTLGARASMNADFPSGAVVHRTADGGVYARTTGGWHYGRHPDGTRFVRTPGPVLGAVSTWDGRSYAWFGADEVRDCDHEPECTAFYGPVELHLSRGGTRVGLPNGVFADDTGLQNELPPRAEDWLYAVPPRRLFEAALTFGLAFGLSIGVITGVAAGVHRWLATPVDVARASNPLAGLRSDRATAVTRGIVVMAFGTTLGVFLLRSLPMSQSSMGLPLVVWLPVGLLAIALSAWGWLLVVRLWLGGTGRLPWRLMAFLDEAHRRGVLRQAGAVYQFRHARLQEQLAVADRT
ncbi:NACHT domain-containing protein [Streptomyces sp. CA-135486]|uniref:NACHT domain-containing protein n=1 Tax=Streptomyces sp. CA-135486 TaxID=3240049 RepID=UPI003D91DED8